MYNGQCFEDSEESRLLEHEEDSDDNLTVMKCQIKCVNLVIYKIKVTFKT